MLFPKNFRNGSTRRGNSGRGGPLLARGPRGVRVSRRVETGATCLAGLVEWGAT